MTFELKQLHVIDVCMTERERETETKTEREGSFMEAAYDTRFRITFYSLSNAFVKKKIIIIHWHLKSSNIKQCAL